MNVTEALQASDDSGAAPMWLPWRTGRKVGRTIYAVVGDAPDDRDLLIGMMDTRELADEAVLSHNAALRTAHS